MLARYVSSPLDSTVALKRLELVKSRLMKLEVSVTAYLFGSAAQNKMDSYSDIDVYVVFDTLEDLKKSSRFLYSASAEVLFPIDWVLTTRDQHQTQAKIGGLAFDIEQSGLLFYESSK